MVLIINSIRKVANTLKISAYKKEEYSQIFKTLASFLTNSPKDFFISEPTKKKAAISVPLSLTEEGFLNLKEKLGSFKELITHGDIRTEPAYTKSPFNVIYMVSQFLIAVIMKLQNIELKDKEWYNGNKVYIDKFYKIWGSDSENGVDITRKMFAYYRSKSSDEAKTDLANKLQESSDIFVKLGEW